MVKFLVALQFVHYAALTEKFALITVMKYLTDVWELGLMHAAGLINLWIGTTKLMPFVFLFLTDNCIKNSYTMIIFSTAASGLGMGLLSISSPSWLYSKITGTCNEYTIKCIDDRQQLLFYFALIFILIGKSAREATMETISFRGKPFEREMKRYFVGYSDPLRVTMMVGLLFSFTEAWSIRFGISAVFNFIALYLLMGKSFSHKRDIKVPEISPVTILLRVFVASFSRIFKDHPYDPVGQDDPQLHQSSITVEEDYPSSGSTRLLENAETRPASDSHNSWILCSPQDLEVTKGFVTLLPVMHVFIFLGLISSMGNTFFVTQADRLNPSIGFWHYVTVSQLFSFYEGSKNYNRKFSSQTFEFSFRDPHDNRLLTAMIFAIPCCLAAALVEISRLNVISKHDPDSTIPMTTFWLIPQFTFLGVVDGFMERSLDLFFMREMPWSMRNYGVLISRGFVGLGTVSSVLFVYVISKVSKMGGGASWFQTTMETSRVDLFYWLLMVLCVVLLVTWVLLYVYVGLVWNTQRPLDYTEDEIHRFMKPGRDVYSIEDGEIGDKMVEAVLLEYFVIKARARQAAVK